MLDAYKPLPSPADPPDAPFAPSFVQSLLTRVADPAAMYDDRVRGRRVPLVNPPPRRRETTSKDKPSRSKATKLHVHGGWRLESDAEQFALFVPLHRLWLGYISELLGLTPQHKVPNGAAMHAKLVKADLHGSWLTVHRSRNPCLVGLAGIVLHESENAFRVITRANRVKLLPKRGSVFVLALPLSSILSPSSSSIVLDAPHFTLDLYGSHFCFRAADRAGRKFKPKDTIEL